MTGRVMSVSPCFLVSRTKRGRARVDVGQTLRPNVDRNLLLEARDHVSHQLTNLVHGEDDAAGQDSPLLAAEFAVSDVPKLRATTHDTVTEDLLDRRVADDPQPEASTVVLDPAMRHDGVLAHRDGFTVKLHVRDIREGSEQTRQTLLGYDSPKASGHSQLGVGVRIDKAQARGSVVVAGDGSLQRDLFFATDDNALQDETATRPRESVPHAGHAGLAITCREALAALAGAPYGNGRCSDVDARAKRCRAVA